MTTSPPTDLPEASCSVEVAVDPHTAFAAFTDEMDHWWMRSPISYYDSARAVGRRCEHGVGGRLLEIYDDATGDVLVLGRITVWEPGVRLQWRSSVDDVEVDVSFAASATGTNVRVDARVVPGGNPDSTGSFSFVRMTPDWFVKWCARRDTASREIRDLSRLNLVLFSRKPVTLARWLADAFGFDAPLLPESDDDAEWIEFHLGDGALILRPSAADAGGAGRGEHGATYMPFVYVDDVDAHFEHAQGAGATIVEPIHQHGYRAYVVEDLESRRWTFAQARPTMS